MFDRLARVVAQIYGQAGRSIRRPVSANPGGLLANQLGPEQVSARMLQSNQERL